MNKLYTKLYEAINTGIQKALIISDNIANDVSVKWYEKEKTTDFIPYEYRFVDMGLESGLLWAEYNIGAFPGLKAENWYGSYYAWGETDVKNDYLWRNYKHCTESTGSLIKYNIDKKYGIKDNKIQLEHIDDTASQILGKQYRMPTKEEFEELLNNTVNEWVENYKDIYGLNGRLFTSKTNANVLFFPAAGYFYGSSLDFDGSNGNVWTASLDSDAAISAQYLYFHSKNCGIHGGFRRFGRSVRAVHNSILK